MESTGKKSPSASPPQKHDPAATQVVASDMGATVVTDPGAAAPLQAGLEATLVDQTQPGAAKANANLEATIVTDEGSSAAPKENRPAPSSPASRSPAPAKEGASAKDGGWEGRVFGDFKVIRKLGQGGMGEVFLAHQISLDRDVALKTLAKHIAQNPNFVERFYREARTMAKLDHPNIVRGYAVGEVDGIHHVAMELIDGKSMQDWLTKQGRLTVGDTVHVAVRVADALQHAHDIKLIHRDIKPDNILVTNKGIVKVSDLGLAKNTEDDMSMTQSGTGLGTPYYMPPEQARNAKYVDHRSDIYALGSTIYHFLTGAYPFKADSALELILLKEKGQFPSIRRLNPEVPERLSLIIEKAMSKDPKHRHQSCSELIRDLQSLGLENETLSFIPSAAPPSSPVRPATVAPGMGATRGAAPPAARLPTAGAPGAVPPADAAVSTGQVWYVKYPTPEGKAASAKFSTEQLLKVIKTEQLDLRAKACKTPKGDYLPLSAFSEFEQAVRSRLAKLEADKRGQSMKKVYAKIDRADRWHKFTRKIKGLLGNVAGFISLIVYLVIIAALGIGGYIGIRYYAYPMIAEKYLNKPAISAGAGATPPATVAPPGKSP